MRGAVFIVSLAALATTGGNPAEGAEGVCQVPPKSKIVASTPAVVVYARSVDGPVYRKIYACRTRDGTRQRLDRDVGPLGDTNTVYRPVVVAGSQVVYASNELTDQVSSGETGLLRLDVATFREFGVEFINGACTCWSSIVLRPSGAVAWVRPPLDANRSLSGRDQWVVLKCDPGCRKPTILDWGRKIRPASLSWSGRRLKWTNGRQRRSARLK